MDERYIKKIMKETCFRSLSYCCDKKCDSRDLVIKKLGITEKDFKNLKNKFDLELFKLLENKTPAGKLQGSRKQRGRLLQKEKNI